MKAHAKHHGCFQTFHRECVVEWININKECPTCRAKIRNKALLFPIRERTSIELKEDIAISEYRRIREPNRMRVVKNIKERNEDTLYIDEIEYDDNDDNDNDEMPELIDPDHPSYYDPPYYDNWNRISSNYIGGSNVYHHLGLNMPAIGQMIPYGGDFDGDEFNTYPFVNHSSNMPNTEPIYYDDGLDSLLVPNAIPNIELATLEDLIITPEINILEEVD